MGIVRSANLAIERLVDGPDVERANLGQTGQHIVPVRRRRQELVHERLDQLRLKNVPVKQGRRFWRCG
eukprot:scaffold4841_cov121-Isochrysis_galbana.AAC.7